MIWSQENCLIGNHRLTCERWGGDWFMLFYWMGFSLRRKAHFFICAREQEKKI